MNAVSIIPYLIYKDAPKAIEWLCNAFNFERHLVIPGQNGMISHAELKLDGIMIMLSSFTINKTNEFSKLLKHPSETGGCETQAPYIIMEDSNLDEHYARAKAAGAKIIVDLREEDYGGRNYSCADPEGHIWSFGSYNPWKNKPDND